MVQASATHPGRGDSLPCLHASLERDVGPGCVRIVTEGGVGWGLWVMVGMALTPKSHWEAGGWGLVLLTLCLCVCVCV